MGMEMDVIVGYPILINNLKMLYLQESSAKEAACRPVRLWAI